MAIEDLIRKQFSCDSITVLSAEEYHCNQDNKTSFLRAIVITFYAKDRVKHFYSYLNTKQLSLFDGVINIKVTEDEEPASHFDSTLSVYMVISLTVCFIVIIVIIPIIITSTSAKKSTCRKKDIK